MSIDMKWLEQKVLLRELSAEEKAALACLTEETFSAGEKIITEGQPGGMLYILRAGKASVEDSNRYEGRISIADIEEEGSLFGELTFLNNKMATADVTASEDCVVYKLSHSDFSDLMSKQQQLAYSIFTMILNHQSKVILSMKVRLMPMLRNLKKKAGKLPLIVKLLPIIFALIYTLALVYVSFLEK